MIPTCSNAFGVTTCCPDSIVTVSNHGNLFWYGPLTQHSFCLLPHTSVSVCVWCYANAWPRSQEETKRDNSCNKSLAASVRHAENSAYILKGNTFTSHCACVCVYLFLKAMPSWVVTVVRLRRVRWGGGRMKISAVSYSSEWAGVLNWITSVAEEKHTERKNNTR